jgi:hypothetical protein
LYLLNDTRLSSPWKMVAMSHLGFDDRPQIY